MRTRGQEVFVTHAIPFPRPVGNLPMTSPPARWIADRPRHWIHEHTRFRSQGVVGHFAPIRPKLALLSGPADTRSRRTGFAETCDSVRASP